MSMANGTQQSKLNFKPRKLTHEVRPDAPEGGWEVMIAKGLCKPCSTAAEKGGDPGILLTLKLLKADDEKNDSFVGGTIVQRIYYYAEDNADKRKAANAQLRTAMSLAEALDMDVKDIYPDEIGSEEDLIDIIRKLEGKKLHIWTVHRPGEYNGEKTINVDVRFKEPGSGMAPSSTDDGDPDDDRPGRKGKAAARGGRR